MTDASEAMAAVAGALRRWRGPILAAVSGGGDSLALCLLAHRVLGARLRAVVVDHGLQPGSHDVGRRAALAVQAIGVPVSITSAVWTGKPRPGQAHARAARYRALAAEARRCGAEVILVGHTLDDQAEGQLMSLLGSTRVGRPGMAPAAPVPLWPEGRGLVMLRPLLGQRRADLRRLLEAEGRAWIDDPANVDPRFARSRVRRSLAGGVRAPALAAAANTAAAEAARLDAAAARLVAHGIRYGLDGSLTLSRRDLRAVPAATARRALAVLAAAAGTSAAAPGGAGLTRLAEGLLAGDDGAATLAGAHVVARGDRVRFGRDPGALMGRGGLPGVAPMPLAGAARLWDGRIDVFAREPGWSIAPMGAMAAPTLVRGGEARPLPAAVAEGLAGAASAVPERVAHLLWRADPRFRDDSLRE